MIVYHFCSCKLFVRHGFTTEKRKITYSNTINCGTQLWFTIDRIHLQISLKCCWKQTVCLFELVFTCWIHEYSSAYGIMNITLTHFPNCKCIWIIVQIIHHKLISIYCICWLIRHTTTTSLYNILLTGWIHCLMWSSSSINSTSLLWSMFQPLYSLVLLEGIVKLHNLQGILYSIYKYS